MHLHGANAQNFCVSFLLHLLCSLKCRSQGHENPYQNHPTKSGVKVTKKYTYLWNIMLHLLKCLPWSSCFASSNVRNWICWTFQNWLLNVAEGVAEWSFSWYWFLCFCFSPKCYVSFVLASTAFPPLMLTMMLLLSLMSVILVS